MSLSMKQQEFTRAIGMLILFADSLGYGLTFGDAYRDPRAFGDYGTKRLYSHPRSTHKKRLAVDFNLFIDGKYITDRNDVAWDVLHRFLRSLGGSDMIIADPNHFSFEYRGVK